MSIVHPLAIAIQLTLSNWQPVYQYTHGLICNEQKDLLEVAMLVTAEQDTRIAVDAVNKRVGYWSCTDVQKSTGETYVVSEREFQRNVRWGHELRGVYRIVVDGIRNSYGVYTPAKIGEHVRYVLDEPKMIFKGPATDVSFVQSITPADPQALPLQRKNAIIDPLVQAATDCVIRTVHADPKYGKADVRQLIIDAMYPCLAPMHLMIEEYDRYFGQGTGEAFFMGPYLDVLPIAVVKARDP